MHRAIVENSHRHVIQRRRIRQKLGGRLDARLLWTRTGKGLIFRSYADSDEPSITRLTPFPLPFNPSNTNNAVKGYFEADDEPLKKSTKTTNIILWYRIAILRWITKVKSRLFIIGQICKDTIHKGTAKQSLQCLSVFQDERTYSPPRSTPLLRISCASSFETRHDSSTCKSLVLCCGKIESIILSCANTQAADNLRKIYPLPED